MDQAHQPRTLPDAAGASWPELVRRLLLYARFLGATLEEAEDLVHDALEHVVRTQGWFDEGRGDLLVALRVVLRNRYLNRLRSAAVHHRATPHLQLLDPVPAPDARLTEAEARTHRRQVLALLTADERRLFEAWTRQRGGLPGSDAARSVGLTPAAYEAAKKRLRRRVQSVLAELGLSAADLYDPAPGGES